MGAGDTYFTLGFLSSNKPENFVSKGQVYQNWQQVEAILKNDQNGRTLTSKLYDCSQIDFITFIPLSTDSLN